MIITKHNNGHDDDDDDFINSNKDSIFKQKKQARWFAILEEREREKTIPLTEG